MSYTLSTDYKYQGLEEIFIASMLKLNFCLIETEWKYWTLNLVVNLSGPPIRIYTPLHFQLICWLNQNWVLIWMIFGVNSTAYGFSVKVWMIDDSYFNISGMKLSITSLYIISEAPKYDINWTENSNVIEYKSWILASWRKSSWTVRFTPIKYIFISILFKSLFKFSNKGSWLFQKGWREALL